MTASDQAPTPAGPAGGDSPDVPAPPAGRRRAPVRMTGRIVPTDSTHRVTTLELFFDLVFVFAFTQVTALVADDPTARGALRGLLLLAILWFAWISYAWLGNQARADEGVLRAALIAAMVAMSAASLAVPEAWNDLPGGLDAPVVLALAIVVVRVEHLLVYAVAARGDAVLLRQIVVAAVPVAVAAVLLVVGAFADDGTRTLIWLAALAVDYGGIFVTAGEGWRVHAPGHFSERHGLIVIVALGESVVALGAGAAAYPVSWAVLATMALAIAVSATMWWLYFDVVALVGERILRRRTGAARTAMARDTYTYLHFLLVLGILTTALGIKKVAGYVADTTDHDLTDPVKGLAAVTLGLGPALYLIGVSSIRWRNVGKPNLPRLVVAVLLLAIIPALSHLPALAALGLVAVTMAGVTAFDDIRLAKSRDVIRHHDGLAHLTPADLAEPVPQPRQEPSR
ncbi:MULTISPECIES: low temperature requirement protein A [unclassified Pseudofrankia]|uniref:low temperature requirement protein A n=1 Tax=unclassified Pseudofrankia TaxID=2994372 RepID=UPI0009F2EB51|nr:MULTISPECIES: low temperature requirement protein A [unclassified Pseudofrankia]MDT3445098.1 low temperature requirement protein A [Pseudofrankia sp. BMG5.37]